MTEVQTISEMAQLGAGIAMGFGATGAGLGIGFATKGLMDAISRQPEIAGKAVGFFLVGAALAEREVIDRVQQVGLAHTVVSDEAVQLRGKGKLRLTDILVV